MPAARKHTLAEDEDLEEIRARKAGTVVRTKVGKDAQVEGRKKGNSQISE